MSTNQLDFDMTPRLQEILDRETGTLLHPSMKSDTQLVDGLALYAPGIELPDFNDKMGILAWLGVNESVSEKVIEVYEEHRAAFVFDRRLQAGDTPKNLVWNLCLVFLFETPKSWDLDGAEGFEGYVNSAFRIGLKPEFAILCGIHPNNKMPENEKERWYIETPAQHVENLVKIYATMLVSFWRERAELMEKGEESGKA